MNDNTNLYCTFSFYPNPKFLPKPSGEISPQHLADIVVHSVHNTLEQSTEFGKKYVRDNPTESITVCKVGAPSRMMMDPAPDDEHLITVPAPGDSIADDIEKNRERERKVMAQMQSDVDRRAIAMQQRCEDPIYALTFLCASIGDRICTMNKIRERCRELLAKRDVYMGFLTDPKYSTSWLGESYEAEYQHMSELRCSGKLDVRTMSQLFQDITDKFHELHAQCSDEDELCLVEGLRASAQNFTTPSV